MAALKRAVARFVKDESGLSRELVAKKSSIARAYWDGIAAKESWLANEKARATSAAENGIARARTAHDSRKSRIEKARKSGMANLLKQARRAREMRVATLQMQHFQAVRAHPVNLKDLDTEFVEFGAKLSALHASLMELDRLVKKAFSGYGALRRLLSKRRGSPEDPPLAELDHTLLADDLATQLASIKNGLDGFRRLPAARFFASLPLPAAISLLVVAAASLALVAGGKPWAWWLAASLTVLMTVGLAYWHHRGLMQSRQQAEALAADLSLAKKIYRETSEKTQSAYESRREQIKTDHENLCNEINGQLAKVNEIENDFARSIRAKIEKQAPALIGRNDARLQPRIERANAILAERMEAIAREEGTRKSAIEETYAQGTRQFETEESTRWGALHKAWEEEIHPIYEEIERMRSSLAPLAPPWTPGFVEGWVPPSSFPIAAKFASLDFDLAKEPASIPKDARLALPGPSQVSIPLALTFPAEGSILFDTADSGDPAVIGALGNIVLRLFSTTPPGKLSVTIIDPVGLGQNFAGFMHLADFEETLINRRIWTQRDQIEERLGELSEHIEKVIQMYLRNEYATITEYNEQAGSVAEKYHFLLVADFPANFSETAIKRLQSIAASGPRCGVFTLIHRDRRQPPPDGFSPEELAKNSVVLRRESGGWLFPGRDASPGSALVFDPDPEPEVSLDLVHKIGKSSIDSNRVEVPFEQIAPAPEERWTNDTTHELRIPIGRTGATKLQYLAIGKGTRQHALFAGKTGSGKSTLFHVIITNLALSCSPDQVEFYLIDFKKGVEFKCYATHRLPHARVVAIESDREFGLSVLQRVDDELKRRGDMFRKLGVQDIAGYKRAGGTEPMPRSLLIIDEFQELFVEDDTIAQNASLLLDRIVRQGRAFGIHVLLGSQTLGGAYTLARATLGQMVIRVALQCNEADAYLIMDDNNPAPRLLSRPGEGIYNDSAGAIEGNSPFQVVWLSDEERDAELDRVRELADSHHDRRPGPIVFEGNAPADIRENHLLREVLGGESKSSLSDSRCWLGAPNSIKGPTEARFQPQSGSHLLVIGQREEAMHTMLELSLIALAAQHPSDGARFILFHAGAPGTPEAAAMERIAASIPGATIAGNHNLAEVMEGVSEELKARGASPETSARPPFFLFIDGLQRFKKLRNEDEFDFSGGLDGTPSPGAQLGAIITEGSSLGIHLIVTLDTLNNANRFLSRKALSEFGMRVVFQMGANDSASLIDSPQASGLGLYRALFYNEQEGSLETFRPYAEPDSAWMGDTLARLSASARVGAIT